jgi:hypothetical protein
MMRAARSRYFLEFLIPINAFRFNRPMVRGKMAAKISSRSWGEIQ